MQLLKHARRRRDEKGAAALEFALVIMPLLLVIAGIINFGWAFSQQLALDNAAREVARYAVVDDPDRTCADVQATADDALFFNGPVLAVTGGPGPCERPCAGSLPPTDVTATLTFAAAPLIRLPLPTFDFPGFGTVNMTGEGVFRCEYR